MKSLVTFSVLFVAVFCMVFVEEAQTVCHAIPQCLSCPLDKNNIPRCEQCQAPLYAYDNATNSCLDCRTLEGCQLCFSLQKCSRCKSTKLGADDNGLGTCSACPDNCFLCNRSSSCDICKPGYRLLSDRTCSACIANCRDCNDDTTCSRCMSGYFKTSPTQCTACGVADCDICYDRTTCDRCASGFYLKNDRECASCPANCRSCKNGNQCTSCMNGKIGPNGACQCAPNCNQCNKSGWGKCDNCRNGFKLNADRTCDKVN